MPKLADLAFFFPSNAKVSGFVEYHLPDSRNSTVIVVTFK
jgi:hypothetical protein